MAEWTEEGLQELADFVCGRRVIGTGITTYPTADENNRQIHAGCEELERRGIIKRTGGSEDGYAVYWKPVESV
jgi:hypothetical protein